MFAKVKRRKKSEASKNKFLFGLSLVLYGFIHYPCLIHQAHFSPAFLASECLLYTVVDLALFSALGAWYGVHEDIAVIAEHSLFFFLF